MSLSALKKYLPWWAKISGKIILARMPVGYAFWQRLGLFRHGRMDLAEYAQTIFHSHVSKASLSPDSIAGKTIVEIGPGDSIASAIIAHAYGAKSILIDAGSFAKNTPDDYRSLCESLANKRLQVPNLSQISSIDELLVACEGRYLTKGIASWTEITDESVDLIFSQAVLEHIRRHEFLTLQQHCWRVLKPGGVASHRVDLQDHLGGALNNLRFSEKRWESNFFVRSGFYTNRIQMHDMLQQFTDAGFAVDLGKVSRWDVLPTPRNKMDVMFTGLSDEQLNISGFNVVLKKAATCAD